MPEALTAILILSAVQVGLLCYLVALSRLHRRHVNNVAEFLQWWQRKMEAGAPQYPGKRVIP